MGRGVSSGGGQSSLGYLFGGGEAPKSAEKPAPVQKPAPSSSAEKLKEIPAGIQSSKANNYMRAEGQNCGNFLTDRPSTKVQAAPGGGSSLDYLFSGNKDGNMERILEKYDRHELLSEGNNVIEEFPELEGSMRYDHIKLRGKIEALKKSQRNLMGQELDSLTLQDIQQLEDQIDTSLNNIRSRKEKLLMEKNTILEKKITELETLHTSIRASPTEAAAPPACNIADAFVPNLNICCIGIIDQPFGHVSHWNQCVMSVLQSRLRSGILSGRPVETWQRAHGHLHISRRLHTQSHSGEGDERRATSNKDKQSRVGIMPSPECFFGLMDYL
ncbi:hypothetical protein OsI_38423 [Oryza sativa Indica Group]|uniref:K-box domain-containing protein n=1 Tax=Oryza sativa subsp. indica TaxID=39946 RepID=B8BPS7_ORYSI|nr:hypothetical protein OsI_38423 [Oryza sativa Indica Group]